MGFLFDYSDTYISILTISILILMLLSLIFIRWYLEVHIKVTKSNFLIIYKLKQTHTHTYTFTLIWRMMNCYKILIIRTICCYLLPKALTKRKEEITQNVNNWESNFRRKHIYVIQMSKEIMYKIWRRLYKKIIWMWLKCQN